MRGQRGDGLSWSTGHVLPLCDMNKNGLLLVTVAHQAQLLALATGRAFHIALAVGAGLFKEAGSRYRLGGLTPPFLRMRQVPQLLALPLTPTMSRAIQSLAFSGARLD